MQLSGKEQVREIDLLNSQSHSPVFRPPVAPALQRLLIEGPGDSLAAAPVPVMIVDGDPHARTVLQWALNYCPGFRCVGVHASARDALAQVWREPPQVVVLDIHLPRMDGLGCVRLLRTLLPEVTVIMCTAANTIDQLLRSLAAGASGYFIKPMALTEFYAALRGQAPLCPAAQRLVIEFFQERSAGEMDRLSPALSRAAAGLLAHRSAKEIADATGCSVRGIQTAWYRLYRILNVHSGPEARERLLR